MKKYKRGTGPIWDISKDNLEIIISNNVTMKGILNDLGFNDKVLGGHYKTLKRRIEYDGICMDNFLEKRNKYLDELGTKKLKKISDNSRYTFEDIFCENSLVNTRIVKKHILDNNYIPYICKECGIKDEWNGKTIVLQLDHENGINNDNRLENLRFLCPNCHSQTSTYTGRNTKGKRNNNNKSDVRKCKNEKCENNIYKKNKSGYCRNCCFKYNVRLKSTDNKKITNKKITNKKSIDNINTDYDLFSEVINKGYNKVAKELGITPNGVKGRCKALGDEKFELIEIGIEKLRYINTKSGLKFVYLLKRKTFNIYQVSVWKDNKTLTFGCYKTPEEAAKVADEKMIELFGEDVLTNKKLGLIDY